MENPLLPWSRICHKGTQEPGTTKDAVRSRNVSIRVPHTTLLAFGLDLGQQPQHGSQPRDRPIWLISPGPVHHALCCPPTHSSASGHPTLASSHLPTIPLTPCLQRASGPHRFTAASATIVHHLLCCYVPSLHIFTSSGSWPGPRRV